MLIHKLLLVEYIYYKAQKGNFGDDLNGWLWPKFFGANKNNEDYFIGIGSILFKDCIVLKPLRNKKKIVFGSGVKPANEPLVIDDTWDVQFLRGPLSAGALGKKHEYISDGAYALRLIKEFENLQNTPKKYKVSVIPYFHSVEYFNWEEICDQLGFHYISPLAELGIDHVLHEIAASEYIISEAMHGAIIADALRVPWSRFILSTPYTEGQMVSEFKWMDWLYSVQLIIDKPVYIQFYRNSFANKWIKKLTAKTLDVKFLLRNMVKKDILDQLSTVNNFYLSKDEVIKETDERIQHKIDRLQNNYINKK